MGIDAITGRVPSGQDEYSQAATACAHQSESDSPPGIVPGAGIVDTLMSHYQGYLRARCRILVRGNRDEANDLFSRVMVKVCAERPDRLRHVQHFGGWLSRIAYNQFIDDQRERQAQERRDDSLCYLYETIGHQAPSPEQELLNSELDRHIRQAFESLPERLRQAAHMRFYEGSAYEEIATELAISQANARKRIQEARRHLADRLRAYIGGQPSGGASAVPARKSERAAIE